MHARIRGTHQLLVSMPRTQLLDPAGAVRAVFYSNPTVETILRSAWLLGPSDRFSALGTGDSEWALAIYRPGAPVRPAFVGPSGTSDLEVLLTLAWHSLIDDGWTMAPVGDA